MREPWFHILDVTEARGRSIADIASEVALECGVDLCVMRSPLMLDHIVAARDKALARIRQERPDLSSRYVADYFHRDSSTIRHSWRRNGIYRRAA
ncbi:MAG: hypothetical protein EOR57_31470 [Mesorhizobium sp.]|uniref:hypothetical protein n=1 Tax=Mesorhizobium sp. TaxID=1871066 RepID=UPI000FE4E616|nr:hypothetical protein [Mesorhizobium sp.]RWL14867.1 MAG: hypothetical protein EOR57_31470 [Mesorhizobium sp.]